MDDDEEEEFGDAELSEEVEKESEEQQHDDERQTIIDDDGNAGTVDEFRGYLEAWDDVGDLAISAGAKLVKRECGVIQNLCDQMERRRKKRNHDEIQNESKSDTAGAQLERIKLVEKVERMKRMARLVYNLEITHRYLKSEVQAFANGSDDL